MGTLALYIRPEVIGWMAFGVVLLLVFGGALLAVLPKNLVQNVVGLATCLIGVAGLFIFLGSEFLAVMQILIYIGAICIAIVFSIMLSEPMHLHIPPRWRPKVILSLLVALTVAGTFGTIVLRTTWDAAPNRGRDYGLKRLGELLLTKYELMFELISLIILVAIVGAIITAMALQSDDRPREGRPS